MNLESRSGQGKSRLPYVLTAGLAVVLVVVLVLLGNRTPSLTEEVLERRLRQWTQAGIADYDVTVEVEIGKQPPMLYHTEVRDRRAISFKMNDMVNEVRDAYTVEGLFDALDRELEMARGAAKGLRGTPDTAELRASFDETYGFPKTFMRLASADQTVFIEVKKFEPIR